MQPVHLDVNMLIKNLGPETIGFELIIVLTRLANTSEYQDIHLELRKANANLDRVRAQLDREELLLSKHAICCERSSNKVEGTSVFLASS
jgi:hypothetical protein